MATRKWRGTRKKWGGETARQASKLRGTRPALKNLRATRKSLQRQEVWQARFPLLTQYYTASDGLIYFEYDEQQFRQWIPTEPLNIPEVNCVPSTLTALRITPHLRKLSRKCNRSNRLIYMEDIPNMFGIPRTELRIFDDTNIKRALSGLPINYATVLGIKFPTWSHICVVYRNEHGVLWIFEPQHIMIKEKRKRFPFYFRKSVYNPEPSSYVLLYKQSEEEQTLEEDERSQDQEPEPVFDEASM
jgi:hypothetical protein